MTDTSYTVRVMGEGGFAMACEGGHVKYYGTLKAAKAAATRIMHRLGGDIVGAGAWIFEHTDGYWDSQRLVAERGYSTNWREA